MPKNLAIVGGGLIGLTCAWRLLKNGHKVTIFDKGPLGKEASYAAAGMLAPQIEAEAGEEALTELLLTAKAQWPAFIQALQQDGVGDIGYRQEGTYILATSADEQAQLERQFAYQQKYNMQTQWISSYQLRKRLPHISRQITAGIYSPTDYQVDNRLLLQALIKLVQQQGATFKLDVTVTAKNLDQNKTHTSIAQLSRQYDQVILASGAWSVLPELADKVRPIKGQMLSVQMPQAMPLTNHVLWGPRVYLVPRKDGRLLIGATVEELGFDMTITAGGLRQLLNDAVALLPDIEECPVLETWAGLRPGSPDDAPIWQQSSEYNNVIIAMGHYRNGVLLAPYTSEYITNLILTTLR